ncbi:hypothetical protein P3T76_007415 [Phytophthora citrophthora]|uniref:Uncharacterized protein n=1 Tax=Phytophthora citrophthora TaxID=4793 RepID=A0AAD9GMG6_9STRA|nr:hypothetical protein P3T76_007415 [Phytophthora citrophthora]
MVIRPKDFKAFNLTRDEDIRCPQCHSNVKPITCGFYDCVWKIEGTRTSDEFSIISQWNEAKGRQYHRFDADKHHSSVEWKSLLIVANRETTDDNDLSEIPTLEED